MNTMTKSTTTGKLEIGKDILLEKGERLLTFKNKFTGEIVYSTNRYEIMTRDGRDFIPVFKKPINPRDRRVNYMAMDSIERIRI